MVVVMNVVHVDEERREAFESAFRNRESHVDKAEGFAGFELMRRDQDGEYLVISRWESQEAFDGWVKSDLFKQAHRHADGELAHGAEVRTYEVIDVKAPA